MGAIGIGVVVLIFLGANKVYEFYRAALLASNDRYEKMVQEQNARLDRLEAAVRASNEQRAIDVQGALKNAAEAILGDVRGKAGEYTMALDFKKKQPSNYAWLLWA